MEVFARAIDGDGNTGLVAAALAAIPNSHSVSEVRYFTGINLDLYCGIGFCAEHSAAAEMLKSGFLYVVYTVARVRGTGQTIPPCGRCRELFAQLNRPAER